MSLPQVAAPLESRLRDANRDTVPAPVACSRRRTLHLCPLATKSGDYRIARASSRTCKVIALAADQRFALLRKPRYAWFRRTS